MFSFCSHKESSVMGLKIEFVVQAFSIPKRGALKAAQPIIKAQRSDAVKLGERLAETMAGVVVLEQHVDRETDVFNEPTITWHRGTVPSELFDALALSEQSEPSIAAA
jgi:hypothetical protein